MLPVGYSHCQRLHTATTNEYQWYITTEPGEDLLRSALNRHRTQQTGTELALNGTELGTEPGAPGAPQWQPMQLETSASATVAGGPALCRCRCEDASFAFDRHRGWSDLVHTVRRDSETCGVQVTITGLEPFVLALGKNDPLYYHMSPSNIITVAIRNNVPGLL